MDKVVIGTRGSLLALWQANYIKDRLENLGQNCEIKIIKTTGDKILNAPLAKIGGKGLFTKELEEMLLKGEITLAVHSLKDVPVDIVDGLVLASIAEREDIRDCFLSHKFKNLESLPQNAKVGTTSLRRSMQIKALRKDIKTISLRGNVQTRLNKLNANEFDAIILAKAGVNRLNITNADVKFIEPLSPSVLIPAMGQGALGIECRSDCEILGLLGQLNDEKTALMCQMERRFIKLLDGGCQVPIGVNARFVSESSGENLHGNLNENLSDCEIELSAIIGLPNGEKIIKDSIRGKASDDLALILFERLEKRGAREILQEALDLIENLEGF